MTVREVKIRVTAEDAAAKTDLRELKMLKDSLAKPVNIQVKLDAPSGFKLDKFVSQFEKLNKLDARPTIVVDGLWQSLAGVTMLEDKLHRLNGKTFRARMNVSVDQPNVRTDAAGSGGGGGGGGGFIMKTLKGFGGNFGNWFSSLSGAQRIGAVAGLGPPALAIGTSALGIVSALIEALVPTLIGAGVGAGGLAIADTTYHKPFAQLGNIINKQLLAGITSQPGTLLGVPRQQGIFGSMQSSGTGGPSFLTSVVGILKQVEGFVKQIGPSLGDMFRASVPFIRMFATVLEGAAKTVIPAFTRSMELMKPFLPIIAAGLLNIVKGFAGFLNALGPQGMKAGAQIFLDVTKVIEGAMIGLGHAIDFLAKLTVDMWHFWHQAWDIIRHDTAVAFDWIRHALASFGHTAAAQFTQLGKDIANIWNSFWNNVIGRAIRGKQDLLNLIHDWAHETAVLFDGARHEVAHIWDMLWQVDIVGALNKGASWLVGKLKWLVGAAVNEVKKLPGQLLSLGKQALSDLWNGMKSVAPNILSWAKNFIGGLGSNPFGLIGIIGKALHIGSPSRIMFQIGAWTMQGLEHGMKSRIPHVQAMTGRIGGSVVSWIKAAMASAHAPSSWLPALERLVSLESGGNPRAVNSTAVLGQHATGLWQMLPSTYASYAWGLPSGDLFNPIIEGIAALRYIMSNYGSPFNIPGLFGGGYHGYWKGGWVNEPVVGLGMHSGSTYGFAEHGPEYVSPGGGGGGINVNVYCHPSNNPDETANEVWKMLRDLKRHRGHQALGLA